MGETRQDFGMDNGGMFLPFFSLVFLVGCDGEGFEEGEAGGGGGLWAARWLRLL